MQDMVSNILVHVAIIAIIMAIMKLKVVRRQGNCPRSLMLLISLTLQSLRTLLFLPLIIVSLYSSKHPEIQLICCCMPQFGTHIAFISQSYAFGPWAFDSGASDQMTRNIFLLSPILLLLFAPSALLVALKFKALVKDTHFPTFP